MPPGRISLLVPALRGPVFGDRERLRSLLPQAVGTGGSFLEAQASHLLGFVDRRRHHSHWIRCFPQLLSLFPVLWPIRFRDAALGGQWR